MANEGDVNAASATNVRLEGGRKNRKGKKHQKSNEEMLLDPIPSEVLTCHLSSTTEASGDDRGEEPIDVTHGEGWITKVEMVRQAVEMGADLIKADPTDDVEAYHKVVEVAGSIPILVRGGGRASDEEILDRTYRLMQQGTKGIVYGRNVVQHKNPGGMTRALMAIVHDNAQPKDVIGLVKGK